jgi:hypothetical protein
MRRKSNKRVQFVPKIVPISSSGKNLVCHRIQGLRDLEIEFLIYGILSPLVDIDGAKRLLNFPAASGINRHFKF